MRSGKRIALGGMILVLSAMTAGSSFLAKETEGKGETDRFCGICINEVCSDFFPTSFTETQTPSDWIELYNCSEETVNLGGYYLSDDEEDLHKCSLPAVQVPPDSYYVIHSRCDETQEGEASLNFGIDAQGETLYLSNREGVIDVVRVPELDSNTTWSRMTDAGSRWEHTQQTYCVSNDSAGAVQEKIAEPVFSAAGGFYADEFALELEAPSGSRIYYTLDGSEPDSESSLYEEPIWIRDVSGEPDVYAARTDFAPLQVSRAGGPVQKLMVVRAIAIDAEGRKSEVVTNSYLVGGEWKENCMEMYTVSLVTDPYHLFDYEEGIYVLGKRFDDFLNAGGDLEDAIQADANYRIRGKKSERPASIEVFDENGTCVLDREIGIRIHGSTTRGCVQKSFSAFAREIYDGENTIDGLFGEGTSVHKFFLYTNREGTKLRDALVSRMLADRDMATQSHIYCNLFLDGEYWGMYLLSEVYDEYYFENHYGISRDNIEICGGASPQDVVDWLETVPDKSDAAVYDQLCQMIDVQSFIEYYAAMLYLNDSDWLSYNARSYRSIEPGPGKNEDGKWRWGVWDVETTMYDAHEDTFHMGNVSSWENDKIAQALMEHEEFRERFVVTYMDLYNTLWREECILPVVSDMREGIGNSYASHMERFYEGVAINEYYDKLVNFLSERDDYVFSHVKEEFALDKEPVWLVILSNEAGAASIRVNTSVIDMPETWWQGLYFADYPVEAAVDEVYEGYEFLGWYTQDGELLSSDKVLKLDLTEETNTVCLRFAKDERATGKTAEDRETDQKPRPLF